MKASVRVLGHAMHPLLVTLPIGLGVGTVALDIVGSLHSRSDAWPKAAYVMVALTILGGLLAGLVGFVDWLGIPNGTRAKRIGLIHACSNLVSLALLGVSFGLRSADPRAMNIAAALCSLVGVLLFGLGGWLGGELVERLGMGIDPGANPDAPSSLTSSPTRIAVPSPVHGGTGASH